MITISGNDSYVNIVSNIKNAISQKCLISGYSFFSFESIVAVQNYLPFTDINLQDGSWTYNPSSIRGSFLKSFNIDLSCNYLIYSPYVNNYHLLENALRSIKDQTNVLVIDSSQDGLNPTDPILSFCNILRIPHSTTFTQMQNTVIKIAFMYSHLDHIIFMHNDAESKDPDVISELISSTTSTTGVSFTNYDAIACFNLKCLKDIGFWDESFEWYYSDCDLYLRMKLNNWDKLWTNLGHRVHHHVSSTIKTGDSIRNTRSHGDYHRSHYYHKWNGDCSGNKISDSTSEAYTTPYNIKLL
jgi:hypothetical protein